MCVEVYNIDTKEYADTVKQFADMIGLDTIDIPFAAHYKTIHEDGCLCQIDVENACKIAEYWHSLNKDFDRYHISKDIKTWKKHSQ